MIRVITGWTTVFGLSILLLTPAIARAQADDPAALKLAEPDFTLIGLPTALRLPTFKSSFRVTHRFTRPLNDDFDEVFEDFFGLDSGASIGLEYRFGLLKNGQVGILRNNNKTIQFLGQYSVLRQTAGSPWTSPPSSPSKARTTSRTATRRPLARSSRGQSGRSRRCISSQSG